MNQKFTLVNFLFGCTKLGNSKTIKGTSFLSLWLLLLFTISVVKSHATNSNLTAFPINSVRTFNKEVSKDLASLYSTTMMMPCPGGSGVIGGKAFQDYNYNGLDDQLGGGLAGIEVHIFGCGNDGTSQSVSSTTTDENGDYFFSGLNDGEEYRIEFVIPEAMNFLQSGQNGADSRTTVQFLSSPTCGASIGIANPADFCEEDPTLAIPCFVNGNPMAAGSGSANEDALVLFKSSYEKTNPKPSTVATALEIGSTWGITWHRESKRLFTSAFLKRHVGLGSLGLGGLYQTDLSGAVAVTTPFIDVNSIGINVGTYIDNAARGLSANVNLPSNDTEAFDQVGKRGIGGICMSEDGSLLYVVNLTEKKLHSIQMGSGAPTSGDVQSYTIPNPNCSGGEFRPFAVRVNSGKVFVGGVCDAEGSGNKSDLRAIVYRLDGGTFTEVLNFSLDYNKGLASRSCEDDRGWFPWTSQLPEPCFVSGSTNNVIVHPTPQLSAFEFDSEGDLILGFTDRMGNQLGFLNYPPVGTDKSYSVFTGGDILKAGVNSDGSFTIENNGTAGNNTTSGVGNEEGPGGGEFFNMDVYDIAPGVPRPHSETAQGGLTLVKGTDQVITTALDPFSTFVNSGGVNYLNTKTGDVRDPGYVVFRSSSSSISTFAKANGLGDIVALCGEAPIEIGGRIWKDANENGIQDPCEEAFAGVNIALYGADGVVNEIVTTDANGEYYFNGSATTIPDIETNSTYYVVIGHGDQVDNFNSVLLDSFFLTGANIGMGPNSDLNDSDGMVMDAATLNGTIQGWPSILIETGNAGSTTHDNDAGFFVSAPAPRGNISGFVWNDVNENGLQNDGELGIPNVNVFLYADNGTLIGNVPTDASGNYVFEGVEGRNYYLLFDVTTTPIAGENFEVTLQDIGSDERFDSDIDPTAARVDFFFDPSENNGTAEFDAGFTLPVSAIVGSVFNDIDKDGLQGGNEPNIGGVTINLFDADGTEVATTTTDANGNYSFNDIMEGDYYIVVDVSSNSDGEDNFMGTAQDAGDDDFDSDVNPSTGQSDNFSHNPAEGNTDLDAGFFLPASSIVGTVFNDVNGDGLQGGNEPNIGGVTIVLYDADGTEVATTTTDANGNYSFDEIQEGDYYIVVDVSTNNEGNDNFLGTAQDAGDDNLDSDVNPSTGQSDNFSHNPADGNTDLDAGFTEALGNITGFVFYDINENGLQNDGEIGITGVEVQLVSGNGTVVGTTTTDASGNYIFEDLQSDDYTLQFDASNDPQAGDNYEVTLQDVGSDERFDSDISQTNAEVSFNFDASEGNADYDAGFTLPVAQINGIAFNDKDKDGLQGGNEPMIPGVTVTLFNGDGSQVANTVTDGNGNYSFMEIMGGDYYVVFDISTNTTGITIYEGTIQDAGDDDFDSDTDPNTGRTATFNFNPADGNKAYDSGYFEGTGTITGSVFNDLNENGLQDPNEPGIGGVEVIVIAPDGTIISANTSQTDGTFSVDGVPSGVVTVLFDPENNSEGLDNLSPTEKDVNNNQNDDIDSDINPNKEVDPFEFDASVGADVDAGFFVPVDPVMIGDFVFKDCNENGLQDPGEGGVPNVPVILSGTDNLGGPVMMEMTTNSMGKYSFLVPRPGTYSLNFDIPEGVTGLEFSPQGQGRNSDLDSDVNPISGATNSFTIASGETNLSIDAGVIDNSPPLIFNVPPDVTVDCNDIPNPPSSIKGVDNCDPSIDVTYSQRIINEGSCPYTIERVWSAVDACGNSAIRTQRVTVTDTEAPVITPSNPLLVGIENGGEIIFDCDNLPEFSAEDVNATDNCSNVEVKFVDLVREQGDCAEDGFIVKMTCGWKAVDDCGNEAEFLIVIYVVDTKSPTLQNVPADLTINLDQGQFVPPVANTVTATDNCDEYVRVEFEETQTAGVCGYELTRTWTGYDDCGNKSIESQKLTLLEDCTCPDELVSNTLVWDAACDGSVGGMITLDLTADINKYSISISPNVGTQNFVGNMFTDLPPGNYTVTVSYDAIEDCKETYDFTVNTASPTTIEVAAQTQADCNTANGSVTLSPTDLTYTWSDGGTGAQRNDLAAGEYIVTFIDENMCQASQAIIIQNPDGCECIDFSANLLWEIMPTCNGYTNGQVDIEIIGGQAPYTYLWHDGQTTKDLFGVPAGPYSTTITDATGCTVTLSGELNQPDAISVMETLMNGACGEKGAIDIFVSGGTAPYTYAWSNGSITEDLTNLATGSYTVVVKDANSCEGNLTVNISNSGDISIDLSSTNPLCADDASGSVTATVTGGSFPYIYQWSNGETTSTISNLTAGTYGVMLTDGTGCSTMAEITLTTPGGVVVNLMPSEAACGSETGNIDLSVTGGTAPYSYAWNNGASSQSINNLTEGTYSVTVTDATGCSGIGSASVSPTTSITAVVTTESPACGGGNGKVMVEVSGGRSAYTYLWSNGATTKDLTDVPPGNYTLTISDAMGCSTTVSANVQSATDLQISNTPSSPSCSGEPSGSITVNVSGGTAPYTYAWSNGATTKDISNLMGGGYTLTVTDANGCITTTTAVLDTPSGLSASASPSNPTCFGETGSIDLTVSGGSGSYSYAWNFGAGTEDISGLLTDTYTVTITDENGCSTTASASITVPTAIEGTISTSNPSCEGAGGTVDLSVTGGTAPYTYAWSNGTVTEDLANAAPGSYNVMITDVNGCTTLISATVESTAGINITENINSPACSGVAGGSIDVSVTGGTAPYTYSWTNGATSEDVNDLMPGAYSLVVTDANGCQLTETFTLETPNAISITSEIDNPDCNGETGSINITVSGGTAPYTFVWSNGATTEDLNDVAAGAYTGTITDTNGCSTTATATITAPSLLSATSQVKDQDCSGDGTIDLTVSGGTAPYSYVWSNGSTQEDLTKVGGGNYSVVISDANNCKLTYDISVTSTGGIEILVSGVAPTCPRETNGSLDLNVQGGTEPYYYQWSDGSQGKVLNNIPAGTYSVTVTDAKGCTLVGPAILEATPTINVSAVGVNPVCSGGTGNIDLTATGGAGSLSYAWSNGAATEDISGVAAGTYAVTVTDANGCTNSTSATIIIPNALTVTATPSNPGCDGTTGNVEAAVSGGTAPYSYSWSNGAQTQNISDVSAGSYSVTVVDANGCTASASSTIESISNISVAVEGTADPSCAGGSDGFVKINISGGQAPYSFQWTNGATTEDITGLSAGIYAVTISDSRDCKVILDASLQDPADIGIAVGVSNPACPGDFGAIDLTITGGTAPYQYIWTSGATTQDLSNLTEGNYQVNVTDAKGCSKLSENITIKSPANFSISLNPTDVRCYNESNGQIILNVSGAGNYTYAWSNGFTGKDLINVEEGTYAVTVTNSNGCQQMAEAVVNMPPSLNIGMTFSDPQCPSDLGAINIDVGGGTAPYTYAWSNGATTEDVYDLPAGRYSVVVTDAKGCSLNASADIKAATQIIATIATSGESCAKKDGLLDLSVTGGSGTYTYLWNTGAVSQDIDGLSTGTYAVTVYDANGCSVTQTAVLGDNCVCPSPIVNTSMVTNSRCGEANGSIMVMVNGDVNAYQYDFEPNVGTVGANPNERINLPAGSYKVSVFYKAKLECVEEVYLVIGNKDGVGGAVRSNTPAACDTDNGQVVLEPGVNYIWPDGSQSQNRSNLAPGTYVLRVLDDSGCESSLTVIVTQDVCNVTCDLSAEIAGIRAPDCDGNLGKISLTVTGGTAPLKFDWTGGSIGNVQNPEDLVEGSYAVLITDVNGCTASVSVTLTKPDCGSPDPTPGCNLVLSLQATNLTCDGANNGSIGVNVFNGKAPYTYEWSTGATTDRIDNLSVGDYWVKVTDADGCKANELIRVNSPGRLVVMETRTVLDCAGLEIRLSIRGGRAPYSWQCEGVSGNLSDPLTLPPGTYECLVTDGSGCSVNHTLVIENYQPLDLTGVVKNTTCGNEDGSIDLTPTGGTAPYTFEWDCGLFHDEDQFNLGPHTYNVTVTDATDCITTGTFTIEDCGGDPFGFISTTATTLGEQKVKVNWETENETMEGSYIILHSMDGEKFDVKGITMNGLGPVQQASYEQEDEANFGRNYYKIKYIDADEKEYFSEVFEVVVAIPLNTSRTSIPAIIYPNPADYEFALDFAGPIEAKVKVTITDIDGVVIEQIELEPGTTKRIFNVTHYDAGVYHVTLEQRRKRLVSYRLVRAMK